MMEYDLNHLTDDDVYLFNEGRHFRLFDKLGARRMTVGGREGLYFAVWAPNAGQVALIGDFNEWDPATHPLRARGGSGVWEGFVPDLSPGICYKFHIESQYNGYRVDKADPFGFFHEVPPRTASVVWELDYEWGDGNGWPAGPREITPRPHQYL